MQYHLYLSVIWFPFKFMFENFSINITFTIKDLYNIVSLIYDTWMLIQFNFYWVLHWKYNLLTISLCIGHVISNFSQLQTMFH